jgi:hypothetical protein
VLPSFSRLAWSPDGRTLATDVETGHGGGGGVALIYQDGSCLSCQLISGAEPAFTPNPTLITTVDGRELVNSGVDGLVKQVLLQGVVSDPAWSSSGALAVVRGRWIWVGTPGRLHRLTPGSSPSWSPNGKQIVFTRNRWLVIGSVSGRSFRRLVKGIAGAWSPNGRWIAFIDLHRRLRLLQLSSGRVRSVGTVTGTAVDWQPIPPKPPASCATPPGSHLVVSGDTARVTIDGEQFIPYANATSDAVMGCLHADGRERLLYTYRAEPLGASMFLSQAATAGNYAALAWYENDQTVGASSAGVQVFDLRSGSRVPQRGGENVGCYSCQAGTDSLVMNSQGFTAIHTVVLTFCGKPGPVYCSYQEEIEAADSSGVRTLDSATESPPAGPALTDLALSGDSLTWKHDGIPESAQLH